MCSGSFKVPKGTVKDLGTQVVKQLYIMTLVILEEKGEDVGSKQLAMSMVLKRIVFPGSEPKMLARETPDSRVLCTQGKSAPGGFAGCIKRTFFKIVMGHRVGS